MVSRSAFLLCIAPVFCVCGALTTFGRPLNGPFYPRLRDPYFDPDNDWVETTTETQEKEYGRNSKAYQQNYKKNYYVSKDELSWFDARDACKTRGMILACTITPSEEKEIENYLRDHSLEPEDKFSGYWIGSHRVTADDQWIWESNGQEINHFGWLPGEPNYYKGEDCMQIKKDYFNIGWNNYFCVEAKRYICESLPNTEESDKNTIQDSKESLPAELAKMSFDEDGNETELVTSTEVTQTTSQNEEIEAEMTVQPSYQEPFLKTDDDIYRYLLQRQAFLFEGAKRVDASSINDENNSPFVEQPDDISTSTKTFQTISKGVEINTESEPTVQPPIQEPSLKLEDIENNFYRNMFNQQVPVLQESERAADQTDLPMIVTNGGGNPVLVQDPVVTSTRAIQVTSKGEELTTESKIPVLPPIQESSSSLGDLENIYLQNVRQQSLFQGSERAADHTDPPMVITNESGDAVQYPVFIGDVVETTEENILDHSIPTDWLTAASDTISREPQNSDEYYDSESDNWGDY